MKKSIIVAVTLLTVILVIGMAWAQMGSGPGRGMGRGRGMGMGGGGFDMVAALGLTEEQESKFDRLEADLSTARTGHVTAMQTKKLELLTLLQNSAAKQNAIDAKIDELGVERDKMHKAQSQFWTDAWKLLTREQQVKLLTLGGGPCGGMGPGMGMGMGMGSGAGMGWRGGW